MTCSAFILTSLSQRELFADTRMMSSCSDTLVRVQLQVNALKRYRATYYTRKVFSSANKKLWLHKYCP